MITWMHDNFNGILVGVISSIIISVIYFALKKAFEYWKIGKSRYSGEWEQLIYLSGDEEYKGDVVKRDIYKINHIKLRYTGKLTTNIHGSIQRIFPFEQRYRKGDCIGYLDGDVVTLLYQSMEGQRSRGCIYLRLFGDFEFRGFYLEEHRDGTIDKTPLIVRKMLG